MGFNWTPDTECRLRVLAAQAMPAAKIAEEFGITKNSVIGKAHRLGVELKYVRLTVSGKPSTRARSTPFLGVFKVKSHPLPPERPEPNALNIPFLELEPHHCRYPVKGNEFYCGHPKEIGSYCAHHHGVCHV